MTRLFNADTLIDALNSQDLADWLSEQDEYTPASIVKHVLETLPEVDAIPVEYIESEKQWLNHIIEIEVKHGDTKEAERLTTIVAVMDAIISNWRYTTGLDWRGEREENERFNQQTGGD